MPRKRANTPAPAARVENYQHPEATAPLRSEVGAQSRFQKGRPPATYRNDGSLLPALEWMGRIQRAKQAKRSSRRLRIADCGLRIANLAKQPASPEGHAEITTMEVRHSSGAVVPSWPLGTDYNGICFHVSETNFPCTGAWKSLKKALGAGSEETVWDHLAGTTIAPFAAGEHRQIAVKVIDPRANELLVV